MCKFGGWIGLEIGGLGGGEDLKCGLVWIRELCIGWKGKRIVVGVWVLVDGLFNRGRNV